MGYDSAPIRIRATYADLPDVIETDFGEKEIRAFQQGAKIVRGGIERSVGKQ